MMGRRPCSRAIPLKKSIRFPFQLLLLIGFWHSAQGGIVNVELGEGIPTLRQIQFDSAGTTNEIGVGREVGRFQEGTGIPCTTPGFFVAAPDGCNRCYCGDNGELTHQCTRAYCPPGFPSEFGQRRFFFPQKQRKQAQPL